MHTPFTLLVHDDAKADLEQLWKDAPRAAARIAVLLQELQGSQDLLDRLTQHGFGDRSHAKFHISRWLEYWRKGKNLWRLKDWNLENDGFRYRIIYWDDIRGIRARLKRHLEGQLAQLELITTTN